VKTIWSGIFAYIKENPPKIEHFSGFFMVELRGIEISE